MPAPGFRSEASSRAFEEAYDRALAAWPVGTVAVDVATDLGLTRVHLYGSEDAPPLLLVPGAGATAMTWLANAEALGRAHRVIAPDVPGQAGRSRVVPEVATGAEAVLWWLDQVIERLGLDAPVLCGHSYGAWLCLYHALGARPRCRGVALLDPTGCFADPGPWYRVRAIPAFVRRQPSSLDAFIRWEARGAAIEPRSHAVHLAGAAYRGVGTEVPRRPNRAALQSLDLPLLVVGAGRSRQHDSAAMLAEAEATGPNVTAVAIPEASHFTLPATHAGVVDDALLTWLETLAAR